MLKGFTSRNEDAITRQQEEQEKQVESSSSKVFYEHKIRVGDNFYVWIPSLTGLDPFAHVSIHFKPKHVCTQARPVENTSKRSEKKYKTPGPWDKGCIRCNTRWDLYKESGKSKEQLPCFLNDAPKQFLLLLVANVTSFIREVGDEEFELDAKAYKAHFADFARICAARTEDPMAVIEQPEDMPDDMFFDAMCGVSIMAVKNDVKAMYGEEIKKAYSQAFRRNKKKDPLMGFIQNCLLRVTKEDLGEIAGGGGAHEMAYSAELMFNGMEPDGWELEDSPIAEVLDVSILRDIHNLNHNTDKLVELEDRARGLCELTEAELVQYLELCKHSYTPVQSIEDGDDDEDADWDDAALDDDDEDDLAEVANIRARLKQGKGGLFDDDDDD